MSPTTPTSMGSKHRKLDQGSSLNTTRSTATNVPPKTLAEISTNPSTPMKNSDPKLPIASQYDREDCSIESVRSYGPEGLGLVDLHTMPHSTSASNLSGSLATLAPSSPRPPPSRLSAMPTTTSVRNISAEFGGSKFSIAEDKTANGTDDNGAPASVTPPPWGLGKSGKFIDKITKENDHLKKEAKIFKLQLDEAKNELKMAATKMEQITENYELQLTSASSEKALLARRDRQLADIKDLVEKERRRADTAVQSEKSWKEQMEKKEYEAMLKVEEATNYSMLLEGRNKTLTSHWDDQKKEIADTTAKISTDVKAIVEERQKDCERMNSLQATCDQQTAQLNNLKKENEAIAQIHEQYKLEQERYLKDIKQHAKEQEEKFEKALLETKKVMGELRWALQVKKNVKDADTK